MSGARLLVKVRDDGHTFMAATRCAFGANAVEIEPILTVPAGAALSGTALAPASKSTWLRLAVSGIDETRGMRRTVC